MILYSAVTTPLKAPYTCSFRHQLSISGKHSSHAAITHEDYSFMFTPPSKVRYSFTQVTVRRATTKMPKLRNSIKWRISNPRCLDCEIVSQKERAKHLTDQRHSLHHHQPVNSRLNSRNTFISTSHPLLCKRAEARASKWQEQWEQTDSNQKRYNIHPKERLPDGHTLPWRAWRTASRVHVSETYVGLPGEQNLYVRRSYMRPES